MTFDRSPALAYIVTSLRSLHASGPTTVAAVAPIHLVIDGPEATFVQEHADDGMAVRCHPIPRPIWMGRIRTWQIHRRIAYSYHRCFELALAGGHSGVLVCEDDVAFRPRCLSRLRAVLSEMAGDGRTAFALSLYDPYHIDRRADPALRRGDLYGLYPGNSFYGGQAVYFSGSALTRARDYWAEHGWRDRESAERPNDLMVGHFGESLREAFGEAGGIYGCYRSLVQHAGVTSATGLSTGYHWSNSFDLPWHDE